MNKKTLWVAALGLFSIVFLAGCGSSASSTTDTSSAATVAACLTAKGAIMYGTERCPHCQAQKKLFGDAFTQVNFVDCDKEKNVCTLAGIEGYPTWKFADGTVLQGTQTLEVLSSTAHCDVADASTGTVTSESTGEVLSGEMVTGSDLTGVIVTPSTGTTTGA